MGPARVTKKNTHLSEGLKDIGHIVSIDNLILGVNSVTASYLIHYDSLLQNATAILLQNATAIILQNATDVCYKMRQLLQIVTTLSPDVTVITKCDVYYKLRQYTAVKGKG